MVHLISFEYDNVSFYDSSLSLAPYFWAVKSFHFIFIWLNYYLSFQLNTCCTIWSCYVILHVILCMFFFWMNNMIHYFYIYDLFQPKTSTISTRALISVHFKTVPYFSQPIFGLFSYLKNALHNLVIELCSGLFYLKSLQ